MCKNVTSVCFYLQGCYLFKNRPTDGPPIHFIESLYPKDYPGYRGNFMIYLFYGLSVQLI